MTADSFLLQARRRSETALAASSLVPLSTSLERVEGGDGVTYELRHLSGAPPRHLKPSGPKPNPFRPWDRELEVATIGREHTLILNKYPVQIGHMLLITREWAPQTGWLEPADWDAVAAVDSDTTGLWFFNSGPDAGASQPHRHLQLLPREGESPICPRQDWFERLIHLQSEGQRSGDRDRLRRSCSIKALSGHSPRGSELHGVYQNLCAICGLGSSRSDHKPRHPYNILYTRHWMAVILRSRDGMHGFSVNALGFAGYLLSTERSDRSWLIRCGPDALLREVVSPIP